MINATIAVYGNDRVGIVRALSKTVADHAGNWLESGMTRIGGKFSGVVQVQIEKEALETLKRALQEPDFEGFRIRVDETPGSSDVDDWQSLDLDLVCQDRSGILRSLSAVLADIGASIDHMETVRSSAPMTGESLFSAEIHLRLPQAVEVSLLQRQLEKLGDELMVDISLNRSLM